MCGILSNSVIPVGVEVIQYDDEEDSNSENNYINKGKE